MSRRLRGSDHNPVSLFSFQDIMMTVMGIMILITLMLTLQMTRTIGQQQNKPKPTERVATSADVGALQEEVARLREQFEEKLDRVSRLTEASGVGSDELEQSRKKLTLRLDKLDRLNERVEQARERMEDGGFERLESQLAEIEKLKAKVSRLEAKVRERRLNPRLTYLKQAGIEKSPILVEVTGSAIGVGAPGRPNYALWFTADSPASRRRALRSYAETRDPSAEYFVILLRPTAFGRHRKLQKTLDKAGFQTGLDLIPSDTRVLAPPGPGDT